MVISYWLLVNGYWQEQLQS